MESQLSTSWITRNLVGNPRIPRTSTSSLFSDETPVNESWIMTTRDWEVLESHPLTWWSPDSGQNNGDDFYGSQLIRMTSSSGDREWDGTDSGVTILGPSDCTALAVHLAGDGKKADCDGQWLGWEEKKKKEEEEEGVHVLRRKKMAN